jgi:hypothetical protein
LLNLQLMNELSFISPNPTIALQPSQTFLNEGSGIFNTGPCRERPETLHWKKTCSMKAGSNRAVVSSREIYGIP